MVVRVSRFGTFVLAGSLGISPALAQDLNLQQPPGDAPLAEPAPDRAVDPLDPSAADSLPNPAADPNAPAADPVPPAEPRPADGGDQVDPATPVDPARPLDSEAPMDPLDPAADLEGLPADPVPPPTNTTAPAEPAAEPVPPGTEPRPAVPADGVPREPLSPNDAGAPATAPPVDGRPSSLPAAPPADAFPPPTYEEPGMSVNRPTIPLGQVVREPVSIHEARARVLSGHVPAALAALDALATRYPADARVAYLRYYLQFRTGQPEEALSSLERAVAMEYYQPVFDYNRFMEPIQGPDRYYAERVRRAVQDLEARDALVLPDRDEVIIPPPVEAEQEQ